MLIGRAMFTTVCCDPSSSVRLIWAGPESALRGMALLLLRLSLYVPGFMPKGPSTAVITTDIRQRMRASDNFMAQHGMPASSAETGPLTSPPRTKSGLLVLRTKRRPSRGTLVACSLVQLGEWIPVAMPKVRETMHFYVHFRKQVYRDLHVALSDSCFFTAKNGRKAYWLVQLM
jgi:hypothetical protein